MQSSGRDLGVGLFVLAGLVAIAYLALRVGGLSYAGDGGLEVIASFDDIGGLKVRAPVVVSGVKVGQVTRIELDEDLRAEVSLDLVADLELSVDTRAAIRTAGLLGDQYVALDPGAEDEVLVSGDTLSYTDSAFSIDRLIGRLVHGDSLGGDE